MFLFRGFDLIKIFINLFRVLKVVENFIRLREL